MSLFRKTIATPIDTHLDIDQRVSTRAKRLTLKVNFSTGRIELVIPHQASHRLVQDFLLNNERWIKEKKKTLPQKIFFIHGASMPLLGQNTTINILKDVSKKQTKVIIDDTMLHVTTNLDDPSPRIARFLKAEALKHYQYLATPKAFHINKCIEKISIRDTKTRWGSCSHDGRISLSWRLIFAPFEAMDYVIAHEVAHLKHMDHSPAFWETCEELSQDYKNGKAWMREHGHTLMRYGG